MVKALHGVDPGFRDLCTTLFGDVVDADAAWHYLYGLDGISKAAPVGADMSTPGAPAPAGRLVPRKRGALVPAAGGVPIKVSTAPTPPPLPVPKQAPTPVTKTGDDGVDVWWYGEFSKTDTDKRQVFGWASVVEIAGVPVLDKQGDIIAPDDLETAAYTYVRKSRIGGDMHERDRSDTDTGIPLATSDMIESFVVTPEKIAKMGLPADTPVGWWVGYQVHDENAWKAIKDGRRTGFSIHGRGRRESVPYEDAMAGTA